MLELRSGTHKHSLMQPGECYYVVERFSYEKTTKCSCDHGINEYGCSCHECDSTGYKKTYKSAWRIREVTIKSIVITPGNITYTIKEDDKEYRQYFDIFATLKEAKEQLKYNEENDRW